MLDPTSGCGRYVFVTDTHAGIAGKGVSLTSSQARVVLLNKQLSQLAASCQLGDPNRWKAQWAFSLLDCSASGVCHTKLGAKALQPF